MDIEYIAEVLPDGHLSLSPAAAKRLKEGERVRVRLSAIIKEAGPRGGLSAQARELLGLLRAAPGRGGYGGREVTREFIHER